MMCLMCGLHFLSCNAGWELSYQTDCYRCSAKYIGCSVLQYQGHMHLQQREHITVSLASSLSLDCCSITLEHSGQLYMQAILGIW